MEPRQTAEARELSELELRRIRAQVDALPAGPWVAIELTDYDLHGPYRWDPDVEPSQEAHKRSERLRREHAAWRGVRAADGTLVVGEPLRGGQPRPVVEPAWRFLADARTTIPDLLATLRPLWRLRDQVREPAALPAVPPSPEPVTTRPVTVDEVATAIYEAVPSPTRWTDLPDLVREEWRARAAAGLNATRAGTGG